MRPVAWELILALLLLSAHVATTNDQSPGRELSALHFTLSVPNFREVARYSLRGLGARLADAVGATGAQVAFAAQPWQSQAPGQVLLQVSASFHDHAAAHQLLGALESNLTGGQWRLLPAGSQVVAASLAPPAAWRGRALSAAAPAAAPAGRADPPAAQPAWGPGPSAGAARAAAPAAGAGIPALPAARRGFYTNPVLRDAPDPTVAFWNGTYYLYASNPFWGFRLFTSPDLVHWEGAEGLALTPDPSHGGQGFTFWAPDLTPAADGTGRWLLMYTAAAVDTGDPMRDQRLFVAVGPAPAGPWEYHAGPLLDSFGIDPAHFVDDDGRHYVFYSEVFGGIWVLELARDLATVLGRTFLFSSLSQPEAWVTEGVNEAPVVTKKGDTYYLLYSGNSCCTGARYGVGVATAPRPTGPWTKHPGNPILWFTPNTTGVGSAALARGPRGNLQLLYHAHRTPGDAAGPRDLCVDAARFVPGPDGGPLVLTIPRGPSATRQPLP